MNFYNQILKMNPKTLNRILIRFIFNHYFINLAFYLNNFIRYINIKFIFKLKIIYKIFLLLIM
jgi:hypothetical protein